MLFVFVHSSPTAWNPSANFTRIRLSHQEANGLTQPVTWDSFLYQLHRRSLYRKLLWELNFYQTWGKSTQFPQRSPHAETLGRTHTFQNTRGSIREKIALEGDVSLNRLPRLAASGFALRMPPPENSKFNTDKQNDREHLYLMDKSRPPPCETSTPKCQAESTMARP